MNGIIIVDKPAGWTSHDVVARLRGAVNAYAGGAGRGGAADQAGAVNAYAGGAGQGGAAGPRKIRRVGHGGTLDPMATGVLPVFVGRATRAVGFCENADKEYIAGLKPGVTTDTQDTTGTVIAECAADVSAETLLGVIPGFLGSGTQLPPMYSAVKQNGKKLYELARRGIETERHERGIVIHDIELLGDDGCGGFLLRVVCSKGTYIRTLCHDIGAALGCGAAMSSLRRTRAGAFTIGEASTIEATLKAFSDGRPEDVLLPVDSIFTGYPAVSLGGGDTDKCKNGAPFTMARLADAEYRFYAPDGEFLMLGEAKGGVVRTIKSFFEPGEGL